MAEPVFAETSDAQNQLLTTQQQLVQQARDLFNAQVQRQGMLDDILFGELGLTPKRSDPVAAAITHAYKTFLGRDPEAGAVEAWRSTFQSNPQAAFSQFAASAAGESGTPAEQLQARLGEQGFRDHVAQMTLGPALTGFDREVDPLDAVRKDIEQKALERTQAALAGELPVNPALIQSLDEEEQILRESYRRQLGPGFETSTPFMQAQDLFQKRKQGILEGARTGDLTLAESLGITQGQDIQGRSARFLSQATALAQPFAGGAQTLGQLAASLGGPLSFLQGQQQIGTTASIENQRARTASNAALAQGIGTAAGLGVGFLASNPNAFSNLAGNFGSLFSSGAGVGSSVFL